MVEELCDYINKTEYLFLLLLTKFLWYTLQNEKSLSTLVKI